MIAKGLAAFKYFVGIDDLGRVATRNDTICVLNILGAESRGVTPLSHSFSGGNVMFGTSLGRGGQTLETSAGPIPVFNNVREGLDAGYAFNTGVVYLPPAGVRDGVAELVRVNPQLRKVVIITEKVSLHDAREIRAIAQANGIDVFGANCLGIADSWNRVRIGGALGGDSPDDTLLKGSIAIYSNSGSFTSTIANYLATAGWGTTTLISSGKDVYIHFAAAEFVYAADRDDRTKAAVMYIEPGGYYEQDLGFGKPLVVCIGGRWKSKITRAVGHAGAIAGLGDGAESKEEWFKMMLGVERLFTPHDPCFSERGAIVVDIADLPAALSSVMSLQGIRPDFSPRGNLSLKPWFGNSRGLPLPASLDLPLVRPDAPYDQQIAQVERQLGATFARQNMKDCSGASLLEARTQTGRLHGVGVFDAAAAPFEANLCLAVLRETIDTNAGKLVNTALAYYANLHHDPILTAVDTARSAGNSPNTVLSTAALLLGRGRIDRIRKGVDHFIDLFGITILDAAEADFDFTSVRVDELFRDTAVEPATEGLLRALDARGAQSAFIRYLKSLEHPVSVDAVMAAIAATVIWGPLRRRRISRVTAANFPWYLALYGVLIGASANTADHGKDSFCGIPNAELLSSWSATDLAALTLLGRRPNEEDIEVIRVLFGLLLTNGPGTISAQGAKGAVSADGPETPERVQINKAFAGFLTHTGFSHGGNGYEGIGFLLELFEGVPLEDPGAEHGLDLVAMARRFASVYGAEKINRREGGGSARAIPGVNHPVFRGAAVNVDPREVYLRETFERRGHRNVFHEFYCVLVRTLFESGITRETFCVNVDGVIAAWLLKLLWPALKSGKARTEDLEAAAFHLFLFARMAGCAAEIDDHINRGRNMDTRTPVSNCRFLS
ncbi:CoA-binding protein [Bradyrhizobium sp. LTSP885]|uniref:CoA-binding protein n=1 Tax=Bradyrhizobium sp. LTSP885 TaxID=1619232 RepID=UPI0005C8434D|nr:CoA-binding protein [Bradyrhizobium sp. LTSP885]KJC50441.1 CoA-binding protein [Bradyrhizobium sp. LTSP885]